MTEIKIKEFLVRYPGVNHDADLTQALQVC
jgi:hypothetical protein